MYVFVYSIEEDELHICDKNYRLEDAASQYFPDYIFFYGEIAC